MNIWKLILFSSVLLTLPLHVSEANEANVQKLMEVSGLQHQINQLPDIIIESARTQSNDRMFIKAFESIVRDEIRINRMSALVKKSVADGLRSGDYDQILKWWKSPLGQQIVELENSFSTPKGLRDFERWLKTQKGPLASSRYLNVLEKLDKAVRATEISTAIGESVIESMLLATLDNNSSAQRKNQIISDAKNSVRNSVKPSTMAMFAYIYKDLKISELAEYVRYCESSAGRRFHDAGNNGLASELQEKMSRIGVQIAQNLKESQNKTAIAQETPESMETVSKEYALPDNGSFHLSAPKSWNDRINDSPELTLPAIEFNPNAGDKFSVLITPMWTKKTNDLPDNEALKDHIQSAANKALPNAVESQIVIRNIDGLSAYGFYYLATDRAPKPGEYKYMTQGIVRTGDLLLGFTILTNDGQDDIIQTAIKMIKNSYHKEEGLSL